MKVLRNEAKTKLVLYNNFVGYSYIHLFIIRYAVAVSANSSKFLIGGYRRLYFMHRIFYILPLSTYTNNQLSFLEVIIGGNRTVGLLIWVNCDISLT